MELPKIDMPTFSVKLHSRAHTVKMRPMTMKENKVILIAKQANNQNDMINAVIQTVNLCTVDGTDVSSLPLYDVMWMYLKLRAQSVSNKSEFSITDEFDEQINISLNLDDIKMKFPEKRNKQAQITPSLILTFKDVPVSIYEDAAFKQGMEDENDDTLWTILCAASIDSIANGETMIDASSKSQEELRLWVDTLPASVFDAYNKFTEEAPALRHPIKYKDSKGTDKELELSTINDFFLL